MRLRLLAAAFLLVLGAPAWGHIVGGGGSPKSDCLLTFDFGDDAATTTRGKTTRIQCDDCNQNCDAGPATADGTCVVAFDICPRNATGPQCDVGRSLRAPKLRGINGPVDPASTACQDVTATVRMRRRRGDFVATKKTFAAKVTTAGGRPRLTDDDRIQVTCRPAATCVTTTTTLATTTTTTLPSIPCPPAAGSLGVSSFDLVTRPLSGAGNCGRATDDASGGGTLLKNLGCGNLAIGGGAATVVQGPTPDGYTVRFCVASCDASTCTLAPGTEYGSSVDCSRTGCFFGPPLPIANGPTSTCVVNTFSAPASGTIDHLAGTTTDLVIPLTSQVHLTSNATQPCPICQSGGAACAGTPGSPCTGTCDRGASQGGACTSTNSQGLSKDCAPGGVDNSLDLGAIPVGLSPLSTGTVTSSNASGLHCPGQDGSIDPSLVYPGCFGTTTGIADAQATGLCRYIEEAGTPAGALAPVGSSHDFTVASVFCIPKTSSVLINGSAALPGPGAISLVGQARLNP